MRRIAMGLAVMVAQGGEPQGARAEAWQAMIGAEILAELTGRELQYDSGAWQRFHASGRTLYHAGADSWGYWSVRGDRYCSQWPPNREWACYDMQRSGERFRFVDGFGDVSEGRRIPVKGE